MAEDVMTLVYKRIPFLAFLILLLLTARAAASQKAQTWDPTKGPPKLFEQASEAYLAKNYEQALVLFQQTLDTAPAGFLRDWEDYIYTLVGLSYDHLKRYSEAIGAFQKANSLRPFVMNYVYIGLINIVTHDFTSAEQNLQKAAAMCSLNPWHYNALAFASARLGHYDEAQKSLDLARSNTPSRRAWKTLEDAQRAILLDQEVQYQPGIQMTINATQLILALAKGDYAEASRIAGQNQQIGAEFSDFQDGPQIVWLSRGGPADLADLQPGDRIVSFGAKSIANSQEVVAIMQGSAFGAAVPMRINRNGSVFDTKVIIGIPPNLPVLAASVTPAALRGTASATNQPTSVAPAKEIQLPAKITINQVEVKPATVAPGEPFLIAVSYTAPSKGVAVFRYSIHAGKRKLYESDPKMLEAGSPGPVNISAPVNASSEPGKYTIQVQLALDGVTVKREAALTIVQK
jgi:tetratricopeptide (TPR) repeat protein